MSRARKVQRPADAPLRAVGYIRVSTTEQSESGAGLAAQRTAISEAIATRGYELTEILEDAGWSGKSLDRPAITEALRRLERGEADALVVSKLDRLSRSLLDFAGLMERAKRGGWAVIALDLGIDMTSPTGQLMAGILACFAQWERQAISARTREAMAAKRAAGQRMGRPRSLSDDVVARIVDARAAGRTLQAIADELIRDQVPTGQGGRTWHPSTVRSVLGGVAR